REPAESKLTEELVKASCLRAQTLLASLADADAQKRSDSFSQAYYNKMLAVLQSKAAEQERDAFSRAEALRFTFDE
ncbi:MAG: hypothetical protein KDD69_18035, partial [Bdellovibrionales bacterium]|nr:hypothetical protein [Bdellovibrionales bacterium]